MSSHDEIPPVTIPVFISIVLKCIIETTVCLCIIIINILLIVSLIYIKRLRTTQNLLLINVSFACIVFSLSCIMSISLTISVIYTKHVNPYACQLIGYIVISTCHCLMFSYTLVTFIRFLTIIYPYKKKITNIYNIKIYIIIKWLLAFILPSVTLILPEQKIVFQSRAKICTIEQGSPTLFMCFCTGYIIPLILISLMNLITYINVTRSRQMFCLSQTQSTRSIKRRQRNLRLLRQFSLFTIIFIFGWTPFITIEVIDREKKLSEIYYLFTLLLPSICVLIDSNAILYWNKTVRQQIRMWWQSLINTSLIINHDITSHDTTENV